MRNRIIGMIAPKGSGKTWKISQMVRSGEWSKVAIFDMLREPAYLTCCDEVFTGQPKAFAEALKQDNIRIAYRPDVFDMRDGEEYCPEFEEVFLKLTYAKGNMTIVIDEAHNLCSAHSCPPRLINAIRLGRHRQLSIVYITQSWAAVARPLTANTDEFYFYKIIEPRDLQGIRERCGIEIAEQVQSLRRLDYDANGKVVPGEILHWSSFEGVKENESRPTDTSDSKPETL